MRVEKSSAGAKRWERLVSRERKGFLKWLQELAACVIFHNLSTIKIILPITSFNMLLTYSKNNFCLMVWPVKTTLILISSNEWIEKSSMSSHWLSMHSHYLVHTQYTGKEQVIRQHPDAANAGRKGEHDVISTRQEHLASQMAKCSREQICDAHGFLFFKLIKCYTIITGFKISKQFGYSFGDCCTVNWFAHRLRRAPPCLQIPIQ